MICLSSRTGRSCQFDTFVLLVFCCVLSTTAWSQDSVPQQFKGNLHTHSHWSDGDDYPEMIAKWYRDHGYHFLTFTDHNMLQSQDRWIDVGKSKGGMRAYEKLKKTFPDWMNERTEDGRLKVRLKKFDETRERLEKPGEFILIHGEEISDQFDKKPLHLNVSNIKEIIRPVGGTSVREVLQNNINAVISQRERTKQPMMIHVNHPNFGSAITERDLMLLVGEKFFEVYNGHPGVHNSGTKTALPTERMWDIILAMRLGVLELPVMYGIAVDDGHNYHDIPSRGSEPGRGWVMVMAEELSPGSLIEALEAGRFYGSSGVKLRNVVANEKSLTVELEPQDNTTFTVEFIGTLKRDLPDIGASKDQSHKWSDKIGRVLSKATVPSGTLTYNFTGEEVYVRARITSSKKHPNPSEPGEYERAWVQPISRITAK
ncbi:MAG: PHP domain-containing protein [Planctomycetaceae bacterium]